MIIILSFSCTLEEKCYASFAKLARHIIFSFFNTKKCETFLHRTVEL